MGVAQSPAPAQSEVAERKQGSQVNHRQPPCTYLSHTNLPALSEAAWALALASAKAMVDGFCSGKSCCLQPLSASAGPSYGAMWQAGHTGSTTACRCDAEQEGWEVKTTTSHILCLCSDEASRDLLRGKDQSWIHESTFPHCVQQLQWW